MKKFLMLLIATAVLASSFVLPAFAEEESQSIGGFDVHSITFHYSEPVVVDYVYDNKAKTYTFGEAVTEYTITVTESAAAQSLAKDEAVLERGKYISNFSYVDSSDFGIDSSSLKYSKYPTNGAYITHIEDKTAIKVLGNPTYLGVDDIYDDAGTVNPNLAVDENGYFLDVSVDENGKNNRIDDNGFVIDANGLWHDSNGIRIEPFVIDYEGNYVWVPYSLRIDESGKVKSTSELNNEYLIEQGLIKKYPDMTPYEEYDETKDYDGNGKVEKTDKRAYNTKKTEYETEYENLANAFNSGVNVQYFRMNTDSNDVNTVFTVDDIMVTTLADGRTQKVQGSAVKGTPVMKAKITSITVEIDALGTQLYSDVATDPQQKNTIILTTGSIYDNVMEAEKLVSADPEKLENTLGKVIGTAKCVTTKTEMNLKSGAELTCKSVTFDATEEALASITNSSELYLNFYVGELQPTDGIDYDETYIEDNADLAIFSAVEYKVTAEQLTKPVEEKADDGKILGMEKGVFIGVCIAAVVVIAVVVVLIVVLSKKKKAPKAETKKAEENTNKEDKE